MDDYPHQLHITIRNQCIMIHSMVLKVHLWALLGPTMNEFLNGITHPNNSHIIYFLGLAGRNLTSGCDVYTYVIPSVNSLNLRPL